MDESAQLSLPLQVFLESARFDDVIRSAVHQVPQSTSHALAALRAHPEWADLADHLPDVRDLAPFESGLRRLLQGTAAAVPAERWLALANAAPALPGNDPLARCLLALHAGVAYPQAGDRSVYGWYDIVLAIGQVLLDAGALYGARLLLDLSLRRLQATRDRERRAVTIGYVELQEKVQTRFAAAHAELAWALWTHCESAGGALRAEVAALFWTRGDVMHSRLMQEEQYRPPYPLIRRLVELTVRRIPEDPLLQFVWLRIKERDVFAIREHRVLFHRIDLVYRTEETAQLEALPDRLDAAFARAVVAYFRGPVAQEVADSYELTLALYHSQYLDVRFQTRIIGLAILLADQPSRWAELAERASTIARQAASQGSLDDYDTALDLPFHYLGADGTVSVEEHLDRLEHYRAHAQWRWLRYRGPGPPHVPPAAEDLVRIEQECLRDLRDGLAKSAVHRSPAGDQFDVTHYDGGPLDPAILQRQRQVAETRLEEAWKALEPFAPSYVHIRRDPVVTVRILASVLGQHRHRGPHVRRQEQQDTLADLAGRAPSDPAAGAELESRLEAVTVFAPGASTVPGEEVEVILFRDPHGESDEDLLIWLFLHEDDLLAALSDTGDFTVLSVSVPEVRHAAPPSIRIVLDIAPDVRYEITRHQHPD